MTRPALAPARRSWVIVVPWDAGLTTKNRKMHHMARYKLTEKAKASAQCAWILAGRPVTNGRVKLTITIRRARELDNGNIMSGLDGLIDGIFGAHRYKGRPIERGFLTIDDSPKYLTIGEVRQEVGSQFKNAEQVVFDIEEVA